MLAPSPRMGDTSLSLSVLLQRQLGIMKAVKEETGHFWEPSPLETRGPTSDSLQLRYLHYDS